MSRCRKPFFSSSHLQKLDFPEAGTPEIRKCIREFSFSWPNGRNVPIYKVWKRDKKKDKVGCARPRPRVGQSTGRVYDLASYRGGPQQFLWQDSSGGL